MTVERPSIESLGEFINAMSALQRLSEDLRPLFWFRGHARVEWELQPVVLRSGFVEYVNQFNVAPNNSSIVKSAIETAERVINDEFRREGASLIPAGIDCVDSYFLAQHHGLPTRLLDWTSNPLAALFFAVSERGDEDGEVIAILPDWRLTFGVENSPRRATLPFPPVGQRHPLVVSTIQFLFEEGARPSEALIIPFRPDLTAGRMLHQGACFTLHMPNCPDLVETPSNAKRFVIPSANKVAICEELRANGTTSATLFPDLDHLAKEIRNRRNL